MKFNPDTVEKHAGRVILALFCSNVRKATSYLATNFVISAARRFRQNGRNSRDDFVVKVGAPNYRQKEFIRTCQKAGVAFPVREPQLQFFPTATFRASTTRRAHKTQRKTTRPKIHVVAR